MQGVFMSRNSSNIEVRRFPKVPFLGVLSLLIFGGADPAWSDDLTTPSVGADQLIKQIKVEIQEARKVKSQPILNISSVTVSLKAVVQKDVQGGIKLAVPVVPISGNISGGVTSESTQTLTMSFKPEGALEISGKPSLGLAEAINSAKKAIQVAMTSDPKFKADHITYDADFVLKADASGGFTFWFFEIDKVEASKTFVQHLEIELTPGGTQ
jgi:Trypsin-co-occurring domain 2